MSTEKLIKGLAAQIDRRKFLGKLAVGVLGAVTAALALSGCTTSVPQQAKPPTAQVAPTTIPVAPVTASSKNLTCPITIPNGSQPPNNSPDPSWYGNGALWTSLWPYSVIFITPGQVLADGSLSMKFMWIRGPKIIGPLTIEGRRLDASAPPLRSNIDSSYGEKSWQPIDIIFPTEGCWEVTGKVGDASLTFVTL